MLSTGFALKAGTCSVKWMRHLNHKNKDKLISSHRMSKKVACTDDLSEQQVSPSLAVFGTDLTTALEHEHGESSKVTWYLLRMFNGRIMKPLLTTSTLKGRKFKDR